MKISRIIYAFLLIFKEIFRRRITVLLLVLIPATFYIVAIYTTSDVPMLVKVASVAGEPIILVKPRELGLIYIGLAATGFLASFLALNIMQKDTPAQKRLVICGYKTSELITGKLFLIICIVIVLGIYLAAMGSLFFRPKHFFGMFTGYVLCGYIYGSYGLLTGALLKRELEGILFIVLLANLDIGWLQNPIFYAGAPSKLIIRLLPGFNPSQASVLSALTDYSAGTTVIYSMVYGTAFLILAMIIFKLQVKTYRR